MPAVEFTLHFTKLQRCSSEIDGCPHATPLQWRHNGCVGVSSHQPNNCLLNRLFGRRSKKASKLRVTGLCAGNSQGAGEFPAQLASYAENIPIWWRHHALRILLWRNERCARGYNRLWHVSLVAKKVKLSQTWIEKNGIMHSYHENLKSSWGGGWHLIFVVRMRRKIEVPPT